MKNPKPPQPTEHEVQNAILAYLQAKGILCVRRNVGAMFSDSVWEAASGKSRFIRFSQRGAADIYGCLPGDGRFDSRRGRHFEIEVKRPGWKAPKPMNKMGKPSKEFAHYLEQRAWLDWWGRSGALAGFCTSVEDVRALLGV